MKNLTNKDLENLFKIFNKKYFDNQIDAPDSVRFADLSGDGGDDGLCTSFQGGGGEIKIDKDYKKHPDMACLILLHEMCHLKLGHEYKESHGYRFAAEINRLWNIGAYENLL